MGVKQLYDTPLSIYSETTDLKIGSMIQKTNLIIDEDVSNTTPSTDSIYKDTTFDKKFHCDHPFSYMIYNYDTNEIVFTGVYYGPN